MAPSDPINTRIQIGNKFLAHIGKRQSEEMQATYLLGLLMDSYPLHSASILIMDKKRSPVAYASRGLSESFLKEMYAKETLPVVGAAFSGESILMGGDPRLSDPAWRFEHECKAFYAAPCRLQGKTLGCFIAEFREPALTDAETREAFGVYSQMAALLLALEGFSNELNRVPNLDSLTGVYNFRVFHEVLDREFIRARKFGKPFSLVFLKVLHMREMNDVYGHVVADKALIELAEIIKGKLREVDFIARSGSSFYVVMPELPKVEAETAASKILEGMNSLPAEGRKVVLKAAIGVTAFPEDGDTERVLVSNVERMVHESVRRGGNTFTVFGD